MRRAQLDSCVQALLQVMYGVGHRQVDAKLAKHVLEVLEASGDEAEEMYDTWADVSIEAFMGGEAGPLELREGVDGDRLLGRGLQTLSVVHVPRRG